MFHKKKQIIQFILVIAAVFACAGVLYSSSPKGRLSSLRVSETEYQAILDSHTVSDKELLGEVLLTGRPDVYDRGNDTFYYSLVRTDNDWTDPQITVDGSDVQIRTLFSEIDDRFLESNSTIKLLAYNETICHEYSLKLTSLPMINVKADKEFSKEHPAAFTMEVFDNRDNAQVYYSASTGIIHQRGNSSMAYPKQSYKINLKTSIGKAESRDPDLLGLRENNEWILYAPYWDRDLVRNVFTTRMWKESCAKQNEFGVDNGHDFRFVELFVNGAYEGLYALGYMPDEVQMKVNRALGEVEYKSQDWFDYEKDADALEELFSIVDPFDGFSEYENKNAWKPLEEYVASLSSGKPLEEYWNEIDRDSFENLYLFTNVTQGFDCAREGVVKNFYITAKWNGERLKMLYTPWDLNLTWGMYYQEYPMNIEDNYLYTFGPFHRYPPENDPEQFSELCERYRNLRENSWSDEALFAIIDELETQVFDSGAYLRNKERWPHSDFAEEKTDLSDFKRYVSERMAYCDRYYSEN